MLLLRCHVHVHEGVVFSGEFGSAQVDSATNTYTNPTGAEGWAGFANEDVSIYPFLFQMAVQFLSWDLLLAQMLVNFRLVQSYPVEPSYDTFVSYIWNRSGALRTGIPPQGENTFRLFY